MAGLLDIFNNISPEQNQGLLAAAAQILQNSGPSRQPFTVGQALGTGIGTYQQFKSEAEQKRQQQEQNAMMAKLTGLKIKDAESDLANQEAARKRAADLQAAMRDFHGGAQAMSMPVPQSAATNMQALASGGAMPSPATQEPKAAGSPRVAMFERRMAEAEYLRSKGFGAEAQAAEESALKLQPKVKEWKPMVIDGKAMVVPLYETDGFGSPVPYEVAEKLHFANTGGKTVAANPFTGAQVASYQNTVSPDSQLSANVQMRGQNMTDARKAQEISMGGKPPPGYRWTPEGTLAAIPGGPGDKLPESQQKQVVGINNVKNAIAEYRAALKDFGRFDALKPDERAMMGTKYNNMMLQAKEAYNLGVLNGPDLEILQSVITDPRSARGALVSKKALDTQASELDRMMTGMGEVSGTVRQPQQDKAQRFDVLPPAAQYDGKRMKADNGTVYVSRGGEWIKE